MPLPNLGFIVLTNAQFNALSRFRGRRIGSSKNRRLPLGRQARLHHPQAPSGKSEEVLAARALS
jgi:hypothetical protein